MMNILLCCAAGMSTSLLVTKMEAAAKLEGIEAKIWAVSANEVNQHLDNADVLLVGPQVRYLLPQLKKKDKKKGSQWMPSILSIMGCAMGWKF